MRLDSDFPAKMCRARPPIGRVCRWDTKFRIVDTDEVFQIDDYGGALIGTDTIDLYKTNRLAMHKVGRSLGRYRHSGVGIGEQSLQVLAPRVAQPAVRAHDYRASQKRGLSDPAAAADFL